MVPVLLLVVFLGCFAVQMVHWWWLFYRLYLAIRKPETNVNTAQLGVSVVICAKNEEANLRQLLPIVLHQDYPVYEVIVVNDGSVDGTSTYLTALSRTNQRLRVVETTESSLNARGKKNALHEGVSVTKNEILLLTDADCIPASKYWIRTMVSSLVGETDIVLGISPYIWEKRNWVQTWIVVEAFFTAMQYGAYTVSKMPYMGVGRNILYRKSSNRIQAMIDKYGHVASGDDDLLVQEWSTGSNTVFCADPLSFVYSKPKRGWKEYITQKRRHISTSVYYKLSHKLWLGSFSVSQLGFYLTLPVIESYPWIILFAMAKLITNFVVVDKVSDRLSAHNLSWYYLLTEPLWCLYYMILSPYLIIRTETRWK